MKSTEIELERIRSVSLSDENVSDIGLFRCSEKQVEEFLINDALKLQRVNSAHTHLFYFEDQLIGFFTLFADQVIVTKTAKRSLDAQAFAIHKGSSYPAIRIHYIGIDEKFEKQGLGITLLLFALDLCREVAEMIGVNFVWLESLPTSESFFNKYHFKKVETKQGPGGSRIVNMVMKIEDIQT
ncbi:GNAT family N-acetyltransferase [Sporosarcina sp. P17b]|uniref:GNAT family N-acetyltransferase n=1 Tax=Sporosarcina sp. P17b TaxID=2048260 RepID=UPI000C170D4B|nr:GNAT family N-acetyltransferase [Sporosarcina sp. P17b]PIC75049.1 hypothetical protein CSV76_00105 [Sporosarcina sp. P17b]